jgi:hypothetical protein
MSEMENKSKEEMSRRRFLEFTGKSMAVTGIGVVVALSTSPFGRRAHATCCCDGCDVCVGCDSCNICDGCDLLVPDPGCVGASD